MVIGKTGLILLAAIFATFPSPNGAQNRCRRCFEQAIDTTCNTFVECDRQCKYIVLGKPHRSQWNCLEPNLWPGVKTDDYTTRWLLPKEIKVLNDAHIYNRELIAAYICSLSECNDKSGIGADRDITSSAHEPREAQLSLSLLTLILILPSVQQLPFSFV